MEEYWIKRSLDNQLKILPKHHMRTLLPFCLAIITIADNPDSALAALDTLDTTLLHHAGDKARYHLLMAEARYKAGFDDTVTNHIDPAVDYYKELSLF